MLCLETWFRGEIGSARLTTGLNDLKGLFQAKEFSDSTHGSTAEKTAQDPSAVPGII